MQRILFSKEAVWAHVSTQIQADNTDAIQTKMGKDPVSNRNALLLIDGASPGVEPHATILLISPSLPDSTKTKAMKAAMKKEAPIAFALSDVTFYSTVLVLGDDFSEAALLKLQNSGTDVQPVTVNTIDDSL